MDNITGKIFEEKYDTLGIQEFGNWMFSFDFEYWDFIKIKEEIMDIHGDDSPDVPALETLRVLIETKFKKVFEKYKNDLTKSIENYVSEEKVEVLELELVEKKNILSDEIVRQKFEHLKGLTNLLLTDKAKHISHPFELYKSQIEFIEELLKKYKYEVFIYSTPIIQRLYQSLRDFEFDEWSERVLQEAPRNKLQYFVSIKSDIQRWVDDDKREGKNANFFDITRLRVWDEKHRMNLGPMNNYLRITEWLNLQIEKCQRDNYPELETMQLNNHKKLSFTETIYKNHLIENIGDFDISTKDFAQTKDFKESSSLSNDNYIKAFAKLMAELPHSKRKKFVEYQINLREDKAIFLEEVLGILNDYEDQFNLYDKKVVPEYNKIIEDLLQGFKTPKANDIGVADDFDKSSSTNKTPVIYLPDNFKLTSKETNLKISTLDIYQTSLLFSYLREKGIVLNYSNTDLAKFAYYLTGHSEKNIATDKGFSSIEWIKQDKSKNKNFDHKENYNLTTLKDLLQDIIQEIETEIEMNKKRKK